MELDRPRAEACTHSSSGALGRTHSSIPPSSHPFLPPSIPPSLAPSFPQVFIEDYCVPDSVLEAEDTAKNQPDKSPCSHRTAILGEGEGDKNITNKATRHVICKRETTAVDQM